MTKPPLTNEHADPVPDMTLIQTSSRFLSMIGMSGQLGLLLLLAALWLAASEGRQLREENQRLATEIRDWQAKPAPADSTLTVSEARARLDAFMASLPPQGEINEVLNQLHELAIRHQLTLKNGEYRPSQSKTGPIGKMQITVKSEGRYPALRDFLREVPQVLPALGLIRLSLTRQKLASTNADAIIEFTLIYAQGQAVAATVASKIKPTVGARR